MSSVIGKSPLATLVAFVVLSLAAAPATARPIDVPMLDFPTDGATPIARFNVSDTATPFARGETVRYRDHGKLKRARITIYGADLPLPSCVARIEFAVWGEGVSPRAPVTEVVPPDGLDGVVRIGDGPLTNAAANVGGVNIVTTGHWGAADLTERSADSTAGTLGLAAYNTGFRYYEVKTKKRGKKKIKRRVRRMLRVNGLVALLDQGPNGLLAACADADRQAAKTELMAVTGSFQILDGAAG